MRKDAKKPARRGKLESRPQKVTDRKTLRKAISDKHSKALEYLAK